MRRFAGAKGDFAALAVLAGLYLLCPLILRGFGLAPLVFLFHPVVQNSAGLGALAAWIQGLASILWAARGIRAGFTNR